MPIELNAVVSQRLKHYFRTRHQFARSHFKSSSFH